MGENFVYNPHQHKKYIRHYRMSTESVQDGITGSLPVYYRSIAGSLPILDKERGNCGKNQTQPVDQRAARQDGQCRLPRQPHGEQTITKAPDMSNVKWSEAQQAHRQRFKQAAAYARAAMADPKVRKAYEKLAAENDQQPFNLAVSDYFKGNDRLSKK